ncbi:uncharacterized protein LOC127131853 [Lathyrus oleraceus]|uniref:uncharacterized protein LOC127131853 n=1 Tax=Pisum sativum TaxID=3888 RepID=UPI0021D2E8F1|nr:uncharacterized protein LOC127131853 [Pisum sativum]
MAYNLIKDIEKNHHSWGNSRERSDKSPQKSGLYEVESSKHAVEKRIEDKENVSEKGEDIKEDVPTPPEKEVVEEVEKEAPYVDPSPYKPKVPFPLRILKAKVEVQFMKFVDMIKKLYVNVLFSKVLSQMLTYVKLLKEILSKKRILKEHEIVAMTTTTTAVIQSMPLKKLGIGKIKPTSVTLQIEDRPIKFLAGILEDIPVKVGHLYIPTNIIIMDSKEAPHVLIFVVRPFLCTDGTIINAKSGTLSVEMGNERIDFIMTIMMKDNYIEVSCYLVEVEKPSAE